MEVPSMLRRKEVNRRTGLSDTTRWRMEKKGEFPLPFQLNRDCTAVGWLEEEVNAWIASRVRGNGRMRFMQIEEERQARQQPQPTAPADEGTNSSASDPEESVLERLKRLRAEGVISD